MMQSVLYFALLCLGALTKTSRAEEPVQKGEMSCEQSGDTIVATMHIWKNTSQTERAFFINEIPSSEYTATGCTWVGTGDEQDPFTSVITINRLTHTSVGDFCGHVYNEDTGMYQWTAYAESYPGTTWEAAKFIFECNGLPDTISTSVNVSKPGVIKLKAQNGVLDFGFYFPGQSLQNTLDEDLGYLYRFGLEFTPDNDQENPLGAWGAYCEELYVTPTTDPDYRRIDLISRFNGCPLGGTHRLDDPFTGLMPAVNTMFRSISGYAEAFRFGQNSDYRSESDSHDTLFFVCKARLCWKPNDVMCLNRCPITKKRRRRAEEESVYTLVASLTIKDPEIQIDDQSEAKNYMLPILASVGGFVLLLIVIFVLVFLCCRGRGPERYRPHHDSYSSSNGSGRQYQSSGKSSMMEKRSRDLSNYPIKY